MKYHISFNKSTKKIYTTLKIQNPLQFFLGFHPFALYNIAYPIPPSMETNPLAQN